MEDDAMKQSKTDKPEKTLCQQILEEIKRMDSVQITATNAYYPRMCEIREIGEIVVDYKTRQEEVKRTWPLKAKIRLIPLCSLDEIKDSLAKNPEIGQPSKANGAYLVYERSWPAEMILRYGGEEHKTDFTMFDRVLVSETQIFGNRGTMDAYALKAVLSVE